jgi:hypothetical protein
MSLMTVEYLMGSRTVFGVISTPFRLKTLHLCIPFLFVLWALSPLGGQASLRVVSSGPLRTNTSVEISYLNTSSPFGVQGASGIASLKAPINAAFVGALVSPADSKSSSQDAYGNLKVPFLESLAARLEPDAEGWYPVKDVSFEYSSLVGLPIKGLGGVGSMFIRLESSYIFPVCVLSLKSLAPKSRTEKSSAAVAWHKFKDENCNNGPDQGMALQLQNILNPPSLTTPEPRQVLFGSLGDTDDSIPILTMATCNLTTTHVETNYTCQGKSCVPTAVRQSQIPHDYPAASQQLETLTGLGTWSQTFCSMFINSTGSTHYATSSALEQYIANPDVPFRYGVMGERVRIADVGEALFALRFAQLLNTYWTVGIAPYAITGGLATSATRSDENDLVPGYSTSRTEAQLQTTENVLICNTPWLIVLIVSSLAMSAAGVATVILNLIRKGPEVLDSFTSSLRDNPFVQGDIGPSTEDGPDKARRLGNVELILGDVRPEEESGYIAVAVDTKEQPVEKLRPVRRYL